MFTIDISYTVVGSSYTEYTNLPCMYQVFNTFDEAIKALYKDMCDFYAQPNYIDFSYKLPENKYDLCNTGWFKCAYIFGPLIQYDVRIKKMSL